MDETEITPFKILSLAPAFKKTSESVRGNIGVVLSSYWKPAIIWLLWILFFVRLINFSFEEASGLFSLFNFFWKMLKITRAYFIACSEASYSLIDHLNSSHFYFWRLRPLLNGYFYGKMLPSVALQLLLNLNRTKALFLLWFWCPVTRTDDMACMVSSCFQIIIVLFVCMFSNFVLIANWNRSALVLFRKWLRNLIKDE